MVSKLVQALVITYDEIFQALAVEGDVLLLKQFLDPIPPTVQPRLGPLGLEVFDKQKKTSPRLVISILWHHQSVTDVQKPFLDFSFDSVIRWKLLVLDMFFQFAKHMIVQWGQAGAVQWVGWVPQVALGAERLLLLPGLGKSHCML
jgi:hypothetical protein